MVGRDPLRIPDQAESAGCIRLRIAVHEQSVNFSGRERCGQIDGGRSLANAALLVGYRNDASHLIVRRTQRCSQNRPNQCAIAMTYFGAIQETHGLIEKIRVPERRGPSFHRTVPGETQLRKSEPMFHVEHHSVSFKNKEGRHCYPSYAPAKFGRNYISDETPCASQDHRQRTRAIAYKHHQRRWLRTNAKQMQTLPLFTSLVHRQ